MNDRCCLHGMCASRDEVILAAGSSCTGLTPFAVICISSVIADVVSLQQQ